MERTRVEVSGPSAPPGERAEGDVARGSEIGRYVIVDALGAGGMGEVFAAYDPELDRRIALKLVRFGGREDATAARGRLLREAQALAKLSHPNVVAVYDAGTHGDQVFIAMEHVAGDTLRRWLDENAGRPGGWRDALGVLMQAGRGLAAAHAQEIVHRDFKPANVMVSDDGRVRVLDFGLARRFGSDDTEDEDGPAPAEPAPDPLQSMETGRSSLQAQLTQTGAVMGTPAYMAPEQFFGGWIDARTDQFAFCVVLYRALFGQRPFAGQTFAELGRAVSRGELREMPAAARVPRSVQVVLRRGLSVTRDDRYDDMRQLLADLDRCLGQGRRRVLGAAGAVAVLVLAGGAVVLGDAEEVCQGADERLAGVWDDDRRDALETSFSATELPYAPDVQGETVRTLDAYAGRWTTVRTEICEATRVRGDQSEALMDLRIACLDRRLRDVSALTDVLVDADADVVENAVEASLQLPPPEPCAALDPVASTLEDPSEPERAAEVSRVRDQVAQARALLLSGKLEEAGRVGDEALERARATEHLPVIAEAALGRALTHERQSPPPRMREAYDEALIAAASCGHGRIEARALVGLASVTGFHLGDVEDGLRYARHAEAVIGRLGDPSDLQAILALYRGNALFRAGRYDDAVASLQRVVELADEVPESSRTLTAALTNLAAIESSRGHLQEAIVASRKALRLAESRLGPLHPHVGKGHNNLGISYLRLERFEEAMEHQQAALEIYRTSFGEDHPETCRGYHNLGVLHTERGDHEAALASYQHALEAKRRVLGPDDPSVAHSAHNLGQTLIDLGRPEESIAQLEEALRIWSLREGADHPDNVYALTGLARARLALGAPEQAVSPIRRALAIVANNELAPADLAEVRFLAARAFAGAGQERQPGEARQLAEQALAGYRSSQRPSTEEIEEIEDWLRGYPG